MFLNFYEISASIVLKLFLFLSTHKIKNNSNSYNIPIAVYT